MGRDSHLVSGEVKVLAGARQERTKVLTFFMIRHAMSRVTVTHSSHAMSRSRVNQCHSVESRNVTFSSHAMSRVHLYFIRLRENFFFSQNFVQICAVRYQFFLNSVLI